MKSALVVLFTLTTFVSGIKDVNAQFGHLNSLDILYIMPEMKEVEVKLDSFKIDLQKQFEVELAKYQELQQQLEKLVKEGASENMIALKQEEVVGKEQHIQKLQAVFEEELVEKQQKLLEPLLLRIQKAINEIAKEKGLKYVFDSSKGALLYLDESEDLTEEVKKKLNIK